LPLNDTDILVKGAEEGRGLLQTLHTDGLFDQIPSLLVRPRDVYPDWVPGMISPTWPAKVTSRPICSRHWAFKVTVSRPLFSRTEKVVESTLPSAPMISSRRSS